MKKQILFALLMTMMVIEGFSQTVTRARAKVIGHYQRFPSSSAWDSLMNSFWITPTDGTPLTTTTGWTLIGNAGITAGTNFLGTTDSIDVVFKTNNRERGRFERNGGAMVLGQTTIGTGVLKFKGITSGSVTITPSDAAGVWTLTLPANDGSSGQYLQTDGSGVTSWQTVSSTPTITVGSTVVTSGTSGAIPFNSAGVYGEDATQLFWDNTNNRLGVGTASPSKTLHVSAGSSDGVLITSSGVAAMLTLNSSTYPTGYTFTNAYNADCFEIQNGNLGGTTLLTLSHAGNLRIGSNTTIPSATKRFEVTSSSILSTDFLISLVNGSTVDVFNVSAEGYTSIGTGTGATARLHVKGSGATSATSTALFENSAGTDLFTVRDDGVSFFGTTSGTGRAIIYNSANNHLSFSILGGLADRYLMYLDSGTEDMYYKLNNATHFFYAGGGASDLVMALKGNFSGSGRVSICPTGSANYMTNKFYSETSVAADLAIRGTHLATSGTNYAGYFDATGSGATENIGSYFLASGATTNTAVKIGGGRVVLYQGTDIASSSTITLTNGNSFELTGTTAVDFITTTGWQQGAEITLIANENVTLNDDAGGGNLRLAGNANFAMTADDVITLIYSSTTAGGAIWREKSRSVN